MMKNPWRALPESAPFVLKIDEPFVRAHNENLGVRSPHRLDLRLPPGPFAGQLDAPLVVLLANPGRSDHDFREQSHSPNLDVILKAIQAPRGRPFWPLTPKFENTRAGEWWSRRARELCAEVGNDVVAERLLTIELHGYHSTVWSPPLRTFPSQAFCFELVEKAMVRGALIIVARCQKHWYASVPGLKHYKHQIAHLQSPRSAYLSRGNLGRDFAKVVHALGGE